jgi:RHS repeat-associated protein
MNIAADLQHVRSLDAMSRALRASRSSAQTLVEIRTSVVRDMLNARYYDSPQGQFISQDPIFLSSSQNLTDPQSLNAYSYSEDNPIIKSDPNGKCPICILGLGLSAGYLYGLAYQYEYDQGKGQMSGVSSYLDSGVKGIVEGGATAASILTLGPVTALQYYGYYQSYQGLSDLNNQTLSPNSTNYTEQQQRMTGGTVFLDGLQRIADTYTPMPVRAGYDAFTSILNSLNQIYQTLSSLKTTQKTGGVQVQGGQSSQSGNGNGSGAGYGTPGTVYSSFVPANAHSACGALCN